MEARRSVAVVPFGARSGDPRAGAWGRQIARRLVDRFADHPSLELKPVFLVALPEAASDAGYLVFGSTPDPSLAAQYGASLGSTHALVGLLRVAGDDRALEATLVEVATAAAIATLTHPIQAGALAEAEPALTAWLARALAADPPPPGALMDETAYAALLEGMDEEVTATLLAASDAVRAGAARIRAATRYLDALRTDPSATAAEERLLVLAAESLERGDEATFVEPLETLTEMAPRSWRGHYLLGELRRLSGNPSGAVVAFEHADALHPLRDADSIRLAELYIDAGAEGSARSRLRRIKADSPDYAHAQDVLGVLAVQRGDLDEAGAALERAATAGPRDGPILTRLAQVLAAKGELARAIERFRDAIPLGASADARLGLARALVGSGEHDAAVTELDALLRVEQTGETAAHARRLRLGLRRRDLEERLERAGHAAVAGPEDGLADAHAELQQVIAAEPELWEAHFAVGLIARRQGDATAAERAFARVLELWPDQPDALHELGVALLAAERTGDALKMLDAAARLRPDDAGYLADAGFAQLRAGNLHAARERLALASELDADDPITQAYLQELARVETAGRPN
ncbi:MAG TPA: tetratricopeptide repeat protein [Candidatus Limnocylindria bacterium]|nr:tetratricopeptide repeat protein [Candidatus Limnocylindria bacterium]